MYERVRESNAWGADVHVCIHTNAGRGRGCVVFVASKSPERMKYAQPVFDEIDAITPYRSVYGIREKQFYEIRNTTGTCIYCECEFHDTAEGAKWIVEHTTEIGEAIAKGLCKYLGVAFVPAQTQKPAEEPKADAEQVLYRVQVGAFAVRANADRMLEKLKAAGFAGFVVKGKK